MLENVRSFGLLRVAPSAFRGVLIAACIGSFAESAFAQRARENAVAEATDAFGTSVGREQVGLYSSGNARGFSPSQAGNLRIDGLYFDQISSLNARVSRGNSVHVGVSAQGFPFPAPTGVVDFDLRLPGDEVGGSVVAGVGGQRLSYGELDLHAPIVRKKLSVGGGIGFTRNSTLTFTEEADALTGGVIARWQVSDMLRVASFWSVLRHHEEDMRANVLIGASGFPVFRALEVTAQPWAEWKMIAENTGATVHLDLDAWRASLGLFYSSQSAKLNNETFLFDTDGAGFGDYAVIQSPLREPVSLSGEARVSRSFDTANTRNTVHLSLKGRDRRNEFGGTHTVQVGRFNLRAIPIVAKPDFSVGLITIGDVNQMTPGIAYEGAWSRVGQISLGVQKTFYRRTTRAPDAPLLSSRTSPWLYNIGGAAYITQRFAAYASYTRGLEEIAIAPRQAANRDEAPPAELTSQVDAGIRFDVLRQLQLVVGGFEIKKPYYNTDVARFYRRLGTTRHRGVEFSLAGSVTDRLTVVAGATYIDPTVRADTGGGAAVTTKAAGPVPLLIRANVQYRLPWVEGLQVEARVESLSTRYADQANLVELPAELLIDAGVRYGTNVFGRDMTVRFQMLNLTNAYGARTDTSGFLNPFPPRKFELSLAVDF